MVITSEKDVRLVSLSTLGALLCVFVIIGLTISIVKINFRCLYGKIRKQNK